MDFNELIGKRIIGIDCANDYIEWAESSLLIEDNSKYIAILASLGLDHNPDSQEVEYYFIKCLQELGIKIPTEKVVLKSYAKIICEQIIKGKMNSEYGINILTYFYRCNEYDSIYHIWDDLNCDIWYVKNEDYHYYNTGITSENVEKYTKQVAKQFLKLIELDIPYNFLALFFCKKCNDICSLNLDRFEMKWLPEQLFTLFYRRKPLSRHICSKCCEPLPISMRDYESRQLYLKKIGII